MHSIRVDHKHTYFSGLLEICFHEFLKTTRNFWNRYSRFIRIGWWCINLNANYSFGASTNKIQSLRGPVGSRFTHPVMDIYQPGALNLTCPECVRFECGLCTSLTNLRWYKAYYSIPREKMVSIFLSASRILWYKNKITREYYIWSVGKYKVQSMGNMSSL
jgi:hypothetical protein